MKNEEDHMEIHNEYFELTINVEKSSLSVTDLVMYLSNTEKLFNSINRTLNVKYSIGYENISIDVLALEKGSFKIPLVLKKFVNNPLFIATAGTFLGEIAFYLFQNNLNPHTIPTNNDSVVVENNDFLDNKNTVEAVGNIARLAVQTDSVKDVSITYQKNDGNMEKVSITKEVLSQVMYDEFEISDNMENILEKVTLEIVSPVFMDKPLSWRVSFDGRQINAKMMDKDFLETMDLQRIAFAKGDVIVADLQTIATNTNNGIKLRYSIIKVHSYPRYTRITKHNMVQEKELFEKE